MYIKKYELFFSLVFSITLLTFQATAQQLKLGNNPTQIEKSAVLELESSDQGLLLSRVPDTSDATGIDRLDPPDGMIIYFTDGEEIPPYGPHSGLYQRKDGYWERLAKFFDLTYDPYGENDIAFTHAHDTIILHLPYASDTTRGIVSTGEQTFAGEKRFDGELVAKEILRANKIELPLKSDDTLAFLTTDVNGVVQMDTLDNIFWLQGGNELMNPNRDSTLGTTNHKSLSFITNDQTRMQITADGKVGIGTNNITEITDTLTVNGSFRLGRNGSSFAVMARDSFQYQITKNNGYVMISIDTIAHIKANAHVVVNPAGSLNSGSTVAIIAWVRANANGQLTVCFKTTGIENIPQTGKMKFYVYYINPL